MMCLLRFFFVAAISFSLHATLPLLANKDEYISTNVENKIELALFLIHKSFFHLQVTYFSEPHEMNWPHRCN